MAVRVRGILPIRIRFDIGHHDGKEAAAGLLQVLVEIVRFDKALQKVLGRVDVLASFGMRQCGIASNSGTGLLSLPSGLPWVIIRLEYWSALSLCGTAIGDIAFWGMPM